MERKRRKEEEEDDAMQKVTLRETQKKSGHRKEQSFSLGEVKARYSSVLVTLNSSCGKSYYFFNY